MTSPDEHVFRSIMVTGTLGIEVYKNGDEWDYPKSLILVMGPTGAGKSSFIEALAGPDSSIRKLSSSGLEGYTQDVCAYKVQGIKEVRANIQFTVYLIDTPGFADDKISAYEIVSKTKDYLKAPGAIPYILFFTPVTSTRLTGSQRRVVKAFKSLTGTSASGGLTIVTTMWDTLSSHNARARAEKNFNQLNSDIWKEYTEKSTKITKFYNTRTSALEVLDFAFQRYRDEQFNVEETIAHMYIHPSETLFYSDICADLEERMQSLSMKKGLIISDIAELSGTGNEDLKVILELELNQVNSVLAKFEQQMTYLVENRPTTPPDPSDFADLPVVPEPAKKGRMARLKESTKRIVDKIARRDHH